MIAGEQVEITVCVDVNEPKPSPDGKPLKSDRLEIISRSAGGTDVAVEGKPLVPIEEKQIKVSVGIDVRKLKHRIVDPAREGIDQGVTVLKNMDPAEILLERLRFSPNSGEAQNQGKEQQRDEWRPV